MQNFVKDHKTKKEEDKGGGKAEPGIKSQHFKVSFRKQTLKIINKDGKRFH